MSKIKGQILQSEKHLNLVLMFGIAWRRVEQVI